MADLQAVRRVRGMKNIHEQEMPWIKRVEDLIHMLEGTTIGELELTEAGMEVIIRRRVDIMMTPIPQLQLGLPSSPGSRGRVARGDISVAAFAPLHGVFSATPSPTPP